MTEVIQPIPARLKNVAVGGHVAGAEDIIDDALQKDQATINQEVQEAIGTGGSVDSRIAAAKSEIIGDAGSEYNTLGKLEDKIQAETAARQSADTALGNRITPLEQAVGTGGSVDSRISAAINALDASVSKSAGADGLALSVIEENGKVTAINGSIASNTYDAYGSASAAQSAAISAAATDATTKVNAAKAEIKGNATSACDTLGEAEALISAEASRAQAAETSLSSGKADKATTLSGYGITDAYTKSETYTKTEVNGLVDTPHQEYVTVADYASLPASGSKDTIYRVSNYNGSTSQVDASVYSEYAWDGSQYVFLCVKSQIGEVFDISVYNNNAKYSDLADALGTGGEHVPQSLRKGGMSVKYVQTSDNNYVQYRLMADSWSIDINDWSFCGDDVLVENPEWIYVLLDAEKRILAGLKSDGSVEWSIGVPTPVKVYITEHLAEIIADVAEGLATKVDKEEGKSLIDAEYAEGVYYAENPEFAEVKVDNEDKILEAIMKDGTKLLPAGVKVIGTAEYDGATIKTIENPEFAGIWLDGEDKILFGVQTDGNFFFGCGVPKQVKEYIEQKIKELSLDEYESIVAFIGDYLNNTTLEELLSKKVDGEYVENPEFIEAKVDAEDKVLEGIQQDGTKVIGGDLNVRGSASIIGDVTVKGSVTIDGTSYKVIENPEYVWAINDNDGKILCGIKTDGKFVADIDGIDEKIQEAVNQIQTIIDEVQASIDEKIVAIDEKFDFISWIEDPEGRSEITTDSEGKIISYRNSDGVKHENVGIETNNLTLTGDGITDLERALKAHGFTSGTGDWSDYISNDGEKPLHLAIPRCAMLNLITDYDLTQLSKAGYTANPPYWPAGVEGVTYDIPITVQFWDMQGNYFKKKALMSGQGASTMTHDKKNIAIDLLDDDYNGDAFAIKFGNWVPQDSFHMKAYDYEAFVGVGMWAYRLYDNILKTKGVENDYVWKNALLNYALNTTTSAYGTNVVDSSAMFDDTGAKCFPDGFPVIIFQNGEFWGVFSWQLKKHRDNYKMDKSNPEHIHLDGNLGVDDLWGANGDGTKIDWTKYGFEVRNPKNLVYASKQNNGWKYDADFAMAEIAGNNDGSRTYDTWVVGSYSEGKIVEHNGHYFLNTIAGNTLEPVYHKKNNSDSSPDFKNKTGCGWLNVTNTIKVKESIIAVSTVMPAIKVKEDIYTANPTAENLNALKAEFEKTFNVSNLVDYIIINDVVRNDDAFRRNWQWTTYDGVKWWCNLYDTNIAFGYTGGTENIFRPTLTAHLSDEIMLHYILTYYTTELNARWKELRDSGVIDGANIFNIAKEWIDAIGLDNFALENKKWLSVKCRDNMFRVKKWIDANIAGLDTAYNYNQN